MTTTGAFADENDDIHYTTYTVKFWRAIISYATIIIFFSTACWFLITDNGPLSEKIFILAFVLFFGSLLIYVFVRFLTFSKQSLRISMDTDIFYFGDDINQNKYTKNDIEKITIYQPGNPKAIQYFYVYEILFKDGSTIKFSNMMISEAIVLDNFPKDLIRYGVGKNSFWRL
jgi:hypothetical protein